MDENILSWNAPNWVTVFLMAALPWLVIALVFRLIVKPCPNPKATNGG